MKEGEFYLKQDKKENKNDLESSFETSDEETGEEQSDDDHSVSKTEDIPDDTTTACEEIDNLKPRISLGEALKQVSYIIHLVFLTITNILPQET